MRNVFFWLLLIVNTSIVGFACGREFYLFVWQSGRNSWHPGITTWGDLKRKVEANKLPDESLVEFHGCMKVWCPFSGKSGVLAHGNELDDLCNGNSASAQ